METVQGTAYARQAESFIYNDIPYSKLDCQAFVEQILKDCGVRKSDGSAYNWRGSNAMWRQALQWKGTLAECRTEFGDIPVGTWVFIVKHDGGEKDRGYNDNEGNATHVGIYLGDDTVRDSTKTAYRDGVGYRELKGFTHVGFPSMITYSGELTPPDNLDALSSVHIIRDKNSTDEQILKALEYLTKYMRGV